MLWTWSRLRSTVVALELPEDQFVVGLSGAMLANDTVETTAEVELLATDVLYDELAREGWRRRTADGALCCPGEPGLVVRGGEVSTAYLAPVDALVAEAWRQDDIAVVSMLQVARAAVQEFLARAVESGEPRPGRSTWTWRRLTVALAGLELPRDHHVVGLAGALLANGSLSDVDDVELLVTGELYDELCRRGWPRRTDGVLTCPTEDDLAARTDDVSDTYRAVVAELVADVWVRDDVPLVSMVRVRPESVDALLRPGR